MDRHKSIQSDQLLAGVRIRLVLLCCATPGLLHHSAVRAQDSSAAQQSGGGELSLDEFEIWSRFRPRVEFHQRIGESIGLQDDLTRFGAFVPFSGTQSDWLIFADLHGLFTSDRTIGGNFGLGIRRADPDSGIVLGLNCYYDFRDTGINEFQQISPGVEVFGPGWEWRANGYLPRAFESRKAAPDMFSGNLLLIDRFESALSGFDTEFGIYFPDAGILQSRDYGGAYHFQAPHRPKVWGWSGRVETDVSSAMSLNLSVQNDRSFETTVNFGVTVRFSGGALLRANPLRSLVDGFTARPQTRDAGVQLASSTRRQPSIVLDQSEQSVALDPTTGQPLMFLHVAPGGNSDGSFNDPYPTLEDALDDARFVSGEIDTIYVRASMSPYTVGVFAPLRDGATILSSGPRQLMMTQSGIHALPGSGHDPDMRALPLIQNGVEMGNDTKLSGFELGFITSRGPVRNVTVSENVIDGSRIPGTGVSILTHSPTESISVLNNRIINSQLSGIEIFNVSSSLHSSSTAVGITISGNEISGASSAAAILLAGLSSKDKFSGTIRGNRINNSHEGVVLVTPPSGLMIEDNVIGDTARSSILVYLSPAFGNDPGSDLLIAGNRITGRNNNLTPAEFSRLFDVEVEPETELPLHFIGGRDGILLFGDLSGVRIRENRIERATVGIGAYGGDGGTQQGFNAAVFDAEITDNVIDQSGYGILMNVGQLESNAPEYRIHRNQITNSFRGIDINSPNNSTVKGAIDGNRISNVLRDGIDLRANRFEGSITNNVVGRTSGTGIRLVSPHVIGDVSRNVVTEHGEFGINGDVGISVSGGRLGEPNDTQLSGDIAGNTVLEYRGTGIDVFDFNRMVGNISGNEVSDNGQGIRVEFRGDDSEFVGGIMGNTTEDNLGSGLLIRDVDSMRGDIGGNTSSNNAADGIAVIIGEHFVGDIRDNRTEYNIGSGLLIGDVDSMWGDISGNTSINNSAHGIAVFLGEEFVGDIVDNTSDDNLGSGLLIQGVRLNSQLVSRLSSNTVRRNGQRGMTLGGLRRLVGEIEANVSLDNESHGLLVNAAPIEPATLSIRNNSFSGNFNGSTPEVVIDNVGESDLDLILESNVSLNPPDAMPGNVILLNSGSGDFNVSPVNVNASNIGTVTSPGNSVVIP